MWRRTVQLVRMVVVQFMCCGILLSDAGFTVVYQCPLPIWVRVPRWQLEWHVDMVRCCVLLPSRHSKRDVKQVLRQWCDLHVVVADLGKQ